MKKLLAIMVIGCSLAACNSSSDKKAEDTKDTATKMMDTATKMMDTATKMMDTTKMMVDTASKPKP